MKIRVHTHKPGAVALEALEIGDEVLIGELLRQVFNAQDEQFDLFSQEQAVPHGRQLSVHDAGIKQGDHLYFRPRLKEVRVHIDQQVHQSPNVTTGIALYNLGTVAAGLHLYREVTGDREDEPTFRDAEVFELRQDEHFHSSEIAFRGYEIFVNTQPRLVHKRVLTFEEIVDLAFNPHPIGTDQEFTVTFRNAAGRRHQGTLAPGQVVKVKDGTIFDVTSTNRS